MMHTEDVQTLVDLWTAMKSYIPVKDRGAAADHFLTIITDGGLIDFEIQYNDFVGICTTLDKSVRVKVQEEIGDPDEFDDIDG